MERRWRLERWWCAHAGYGYHSHDSWVDGYHSHVELRVGQDHEEWEDVERERTPARVGTTRKWVWRRRWKKKAEVGRKGKLHARGRRLFHPLHPHHHHHHHDSHSHSPHVVDVEWGVLEDVQHGPSLARWTVPLPFGVSFSFFPQPESSLRVPWWCRHTLSPCSAHDGDHHALDWRKVLEAWWYAWWWKRIRMAKMGGVARGSQEGLPAVVEPFLKYKGKCRKWRHHQHHLHLL